MPAQKSHDPGVARIPQCLINKVMTAQTCSPSPDLTRLSEVLPSNPDAESFSMPRTVIVEFPESRSSWTADPVQQDGGEADNGAPALESDSEETRPNEPTQETPRQGAADDPLRVYLQQMGPLPLLSRNEEIEICRKIESAQNEVKRIVLEFGFACKEHIALARKLLATPPKERFDRLIVDSKLADRERHLQLLEKLVKRADMLDRELDAKYHQWRSSSDPQERLVLGREIQKLKARVRLILPRLGLQRKVVEELSIIARNLYAQFQSVSAQMIQLERSCQSSERETQLQSIREKMEALERFVRMPWNEY